MKMEEFVLAIVALTDRGPSLLRGLVAALALTVISGCEVPESPEWDVGLIVPFSTDPIAVTDFLPTGVRADTVNGTPVFSIEPQSAAEAYDLGTLCGAPCLVLEGQNSTVPTFVYEDSIEVALPANVVSAEVITARLAIDLTNGLNFDPLRPHPDPDSAGWILLETRDQTGAFLDSTLVRGSDQTLGANTTLQIEIVLTGVEIREGLRTRVVVSSPEDGQTVQIDNSMTAGFDVSMNDIAVSGVRVVVDGESLQESFQLDSDADLRNEVNERIQNGTLELTLTHNLEIDGTLDVSIAGSNADLFSGDPAREVRLSNFDLSFAPQGRVFERTLTVNELNFIAGLPELFVEYRAVASGSVIDAGRPTTRLTPDLFIESQVKLMTQVRVGG